MKPRQKLVIIALFALSLVVLLHNYITMIAGCRYAYDLGIYQQAFYDLAYSGSLNPYNTLRGIQIFADHFDPIIFVAALIQKVLGPNRMIALLFEFFIYWAGGFFLLCVLKKESFRFQAFILALWLFNEPIQVALRFPIHPTTWSVLPLLLLVYFLKNENFKWSYICAVFLCAFKESYPFALLTWGAYLLFRKEYRRSALVLITGVLFTYFDFVLRKQLIPGVYAHGDFMVADMIHHPLQTLIDATLKFDWRGTLRELSPALLALPLAIRFSQKRDWIWETAAYCLPIFGIQFLYGTIRFHYGGAIIAPLIAIIAFGSSEWFTREEKFFKRYALLLLLVVTYFGGDMVVKAAQVWIPHPSKCRYDAQKVDEFWKLREHLAAIHSGKKILTSGGLVPVIIQPNMQVFLVGGLSKPQEAYQVLVFGRNDTSDLYPKGPERFEEAIAACRPHATEIILDTRNVFYAIGNFTKDCLPPDFLQ